MTFTPYYRLMIERDFYPDGQPFWSAGCNRCGDRYDYDTEEEALEFMDAHVCWEGEDDDE